VQVFALPNDRPRPEVYSRPFSGYNYFIGAQEMAAVPRFAQQMRSSNFMVLMAAFSVFSYEVTGRPDLAIRSFTTGRNEPAFQNTMGLFLSLVPFQTDISGSASFREIVARTRETCIDAYAHEVPITVIEQDLPEFNAPHEDPGNSQFILGMYQGQAGEAALPIAGGAELILKSSPSSETSDIPSGMVWDMSMTRTGELVGSITYNLDEFDEQRVTGWVTHFNQTMFRLVSEPDREWRQHAGIAS
jgi:non-ribosomal peptide synthetase component F